MKWLAAVVGFVAIMATSAPAIAQGSAPGLLGPNTISDIAEKVGPSVVNIVANAAVGRNQRQNATRLPAEQSKKLRKYYGLDSLPPADDDYMKVTGSGVVIRPNGYILTSLHVVENATSVTVTFQDGHSLQGNVVARDRFSDLAVVKVPAQNLPVASFANSDQVRLGEWVVAIGNQYGLGHTVTQGIISGIGREAKGFEKSFGARTGAVRFLQTDTPINPGSSGGPLLNLKGEVLGINTFIREDAQNIGFAIPSNVAKYVSDKLTTGEEIAHPYIGIVMKEKDPTRPSDPGVEVTEVKFRSPAAAAGITSGDVILEVEQAPVNKSDDVSLAVAKRHPGENMKFKIRHNGSDKDVDVKVDRLPDEGE